MSLSDRLILGKFRPFFTDTFVFESSVLLDWVVSVSRTWMTFVIMFASTFDEKGAKSGLKG